MAKQGGTTKKGEVGPEGVKTKKPYKLEDFEIIRLLGNGAYGEVYLAQLKSAKNRYVALKQMDKKLITMQNKTDHVKNEKKVLQHGKSPFLVQMHYSFQTKECLYLAMEYCPGGDLRQFLAALGTLEEVEAKVYFAEMIMAVHTLHQMGYIHRDLKPDNFLIDKRGHLKLADFGLSKSNKVESPDTVEKGFKMTEDKLMKRRTRLSLLQGPSMTLDKLTASNLDSKFRRAQQVGTTDSRKIVNRPKRGPSHPTPISIRRKMAYSVVGSPDYMSPEVTARLDSSNSEGYGEEVDWWSLGCVFFEIILGCPPFQGETVDEIFNNIKNWKTIIPTLLDQYRQYMSEECFSLLSGFLCEADVRAGKDINKLKNHPFFKGIDWNDLPRMTPPFVPKDEFANEQT